MIEGIFRASSVVTPESDGGRWESLQHGWPRHTSRPTAKKAGIATLGGRKKLLTIPIVAALSKGPGFHQSIPQESASMRLPIGQWAQAPASVGMASMG